MNPYVEELTGLTREQVLDGIKDGTIHPNSPVVAIHEISPQAISWLTGTPGMMVGVGPDISPEELEAVLCETQ